MGELPNSSFANQEPEWLTRYIWPKVNKTDTCWLWTAASNHAGYPMSGPAKRATGSWYVHRALWMFYNGPIPDGYEVDHMCFVPACVNLAHLRLLTVAENRRIGRRNWLYRTAVCPNGHAKVGDNVMVSKEGWRRCRACNEEWWARRRVEDNK